MSAMIKTIPEIAECIRTILKANDVKEGSKRARTIECSFIQGMMCAQQEYANNAYLVITLLSNRSILEKCHPQV